jgi:hypothetical protein
LAFDAEPIRWRIDIAIETRGNPAERPANTTRGIAKKGCGVGLRAKPLNDLILHAATF